MNYSKTHKQRAKDHYERFKMIRKLEQGGDRIDMGPFEKNIWIAVLVIVALVMAEFLIVGGVK